MAEQENKRWEQLKMLGKHPATLKAAGVVRRKVLQAFNQWEDLEDMTGKLKSYLENHPSELASFLRFIDEGRMGYLTWRLICRFKQLHGIEGKKEDTDMYECAEVITVIIRKCPTAKQFKTPQDYRTLVRRVERRHKEVLNRIAPRPGRKKHRKIHASNCPELRIIVQAELRRK